MAGVVCSRLSIDLQKLLRICGLGGWRDEYRRQGFQIWSPFVGQKTVTKTRRLHV